MEGILQQIVLDKKTRIREQKKRCSSKEMRGAAEEAVKGESEQRRFYRALKKEGISIIGEMKKASPSLGTIGKTMEVEARIEAYNHCVDAVSCLTEEDHFHGSAQIFKNVRRLCTLPMLRKDFMVDEYQFHEAKVMGADAVLLIAAILEDGQLKEFYHLARELHMDVLIETHNEKEVEKALLLGGDMIGINNRDLTTFRTNLEITKRLSKLIPGDKVLVSESGIFTPYDVEFVKEQGADAILVGQALMETADPCELVNYMLGRKVTV
ncbi:MAG: indole-3-glycerol phosphate synthase TrpC [Lachnospiraceae bacterium]|nr:indole-3-glycerol phosphate synthase TrpC [Lachnospiraceae bacterium]